MRIRDLSCVHRLTWYLVLNLCIKELKVRIVVAVEGVTAAVHAAQSHSEEVKGEAMLLAAIVMPDVRAHHQVVRVVLVAPHLAQVAEAEHFVLLHHEGGLAAVVAAVVVADSAADLAEAPATQVNASISIAS